MSIFNNEEQTESENEELAKRLIARKLKDLYPQFRKKRKEPLKPWGKKERIVVFAVLIFTILTASFLSLKSRGFKLPGLPKIGIPSLNLFKSETITIGGERDRDRERANKIISLFQEQTRSLTGNYSLNIVELENGFSYGSGENNIMEAASLIKLPVFAALYREVEEGQFNLEAKYTLKNSDKLGGSGSLQGRPAGTVLTFRELAQLMGNQSDNTAFNIFRKVLGDDKIKETMDSIGMTNTSLEKNQTTPFDIGLFFEKLWKKEIVNEKNRDEILGFLTKTIYEDYLAKGIPQVRVAHKFGRETHVINDAGIVFAEKPFVLVILTQGIVEKEADEAIPNLAKMVYDNIK